MLRALVFTTILFAVPARAAPEVQFSAGVPFTFVDDSGETDIALRVAAGWHFGRHVAGLGLSDRGREGVQPWAYYRSPAWEFVPRVGLVALGELRLSEVVRCDGVCWHSTVVVPTAGGGALMSTGFLTVLASVAVGTPLPATDPQPFEVAFLVTVVIGPPDLPSPSAMGLWCASAAGRTCSRHRCGTDRRGRPS